MSTADMPGGDAVVVEMPVTRDFLVMYGGFRRSDDGKILYRAPSTSLQVVTLGAGVVDLGDWVVEEMRGDSRSGLVQYIATLRRVRDPDDR